MDYLPRLATIDQAADWLTKTTGQHWMLTRLLEHGLMPWFWLEYSPGWPAIFGDRLEGYLAPMVFVGDCARLEVVGSDALVTMTRTSTGQLIKIERPPLTVPLADLRFKREDVEQLALTINSGSSRDMTDSIASAPPRQRSAAQDEAILAAIRSLGHKPTSLPKAEAGKPGVKAAVKKRVEKETVLFPAGGTVFKKAWERLRSSGELADQD